MAVRTVRLDSDAEQVLADLQTQTGQSVSEILKRGIRAYQAEAQQKTPTPAYEIYKALDLGAGDYAVAPASQAKAAVKEIIREKHRR
ncbi:MAG: hypothetical protein OXC38_04445 [Gammaproteobacteria bacterium]|nr:hypothetical protein [Gammaproteobacteria bacterium]